MFLDCVFNKKLRKKTLVSLGLRLQPCSVQQGSYGKVNYIKITFLRSGPHEHRVFCGKLLSC